MSAFLQSHSGVEAVISRIGSRSTQLILIGETGHWLRWVVSSPDEARDLCRKFGLQAHEEWPDHLRRRINAYQRSPEAWSDAPYPERQTRGSA
jgi:hypothetical protein